MTFAATSDELAVRAGSSSACTSSIETAESSASGSTTQGPGRRISTARPTPNGTNIAMLVRNSRRVYVSSGTARMIHRTTARA
ncbi:hypothetical protein V2S05_11225 [Microbacterium sp. OR16]